MKGIENNLHHNTAELYSNIPEFSREDQILCQGQGPHSLVNGVSEEAHSYSQE